MKKFFSIFAIIFAVLLVVYMFIPETKKSVYSYELIQQIGIQNDSVNVLLEEKGTGNFIKAIYSNDTVYIQFKDFDTWTDNDFSINVKFKDGKFEKFDVYQIMTTDNRNSMLQGFHEYWSCCHLDKFYTVDDVQFVNFASHKLLPNDTTKVLYTKLDPHKLFRK